MRRLGSSFRDRDGFVFEQQGRFLRRISPSYVSTYHDLKRKDVFTQLWERGWLVPHRELPDDGTGQASLTLEPEQLQAITYPYEWSFGQLQDAALLTLQLQKAALAAGYSLKDASAYNIQFHRGRPVLIDTLSFEPHREGQPWSGYRQFCQHFVAPLALMAYRDPRLGLLLRNHIDGIPLDLASKLLPKRTWLRPGLLFHLHLHARAQSRFVDADRKVAAKPVSRAGLVGILEHLASTVRSLRWAPAGTEWASYYENTNYDRTATDDKQTIVQEWLQLRRPRTVWDLGANDGMFSRLAADLGAMTVAWDIDAAAVEKCYRNVVREGRKNLLPALLDLTNPSPSIGWNLAERLSLFERQHPDTTLALALIHHLAIGNNVPLPQCAEFFHRIGGMLIIEWVPKSDSKVAGLLCNRADVFDDYTECAFEEAFRQHYHVRDKRLVRNSERILYFFEARTPAHVSP